MAIRSNRSPRTGSKNEPSRTSTRSATSLRAALKRAIRSARWLTSVATTRVAVRGEVQRLHAAAGAEVEALPDRLAQGELGQRGRGGADPEHVVGADPLRQAVQARRQVADHPQVRSPCSSVAYGRTSSRAATSPTDRVEDALGRQPVHQPGQRRLGRGRRSPAPAAGTAGSASPAASRRRWRAAQRRGGLVARQRGVGDRAEQLGDGVVGEVRPGRERRAAAAEVAGHGDSRAPAGTHPGPEARTGSWTPSGRRRPPSGPAVDVSATAPAARTAGRRRVAAAAACRHVGRGRVVRRVGRAPAGAGGGGVRSSPIETSRCLEM